jgi:hypothetical protein
VSASPILTPGYAPGAYRLEATDGRLKAELLRRREEERLADARARLSSRTALRPKDSREAGIIRMDAEVVVRRCQDPNTAPPTPYLEVAVYSLMRPGNFRRVLLPPDAAEAAVSIAGGAIGESLCEAGDPFDPSQCSRSAAAAYAELLASERG